MCLVTASTAGIGFAIAERLAQEGAFVHICSRKEKNVQEAVQKLNSKGLASRVYGHTCNVGKASQRKQMLDKIAEMHGGRLDVLVPNAACSTYFGD